tara:strand:+ start:1886 stop:2020 length:135 start_codon:yes stop_codon:yes gene_type:complete
MGWGLREEADVVKKGRFFVGGQPGFGSQEDKPMKPGELERAGSL